MLSVPLVLPIALLYTTPGSGGEIILENAGLRIVLGEDAVVRSIVDKKTSGEYCLPKAGLRVAAARIAGKTFEAGRASLAGQKLTLEFAGCDTRLTYAASTTEDWIGLRLVEVAGTRPSHVTLVRLPVTIAEHVGPRLAAAWNERYAICVQGMNLQTEGTAGRRGGYAELVAATQDSPGPKLEGAAVAILAGSPAKLRLSLRRLAAACNLPRNEGPEGPSKDLALARQSYWFLSFGEQDVDRLIDYCRRTGFRQVMLNSWSWCASPGHYTLNTSLYPDGLDSLRRTVARLHQEGILVGMHCYASKIAKTDAYVTPVPDRRFWVDLTSVLAADVGPKDATLRTASDLSQWPGSPVARQTIWEGGVVKHQEVILEDEIVRYQAIGRQGKWDTFLGCQRGSYGTRPAAHKAGTTGRHYGVDGCINGYIIDQETTLLDEATSRLAEVFNACDFDMVYFDGGEDVPRGRFNYYVSKFQATAMGKFRKRPLVHMGTIMTHNLWHSFTRSGTVDTYLNTLHGHIQAGGKIDTWPTVRQHVDSSVAYMLSVGDDMMPGELGWFGIWSKGTNTDGLQLDEIEYLMARSLAYNAPISLETSFGQMEGHPLTPGILEIVGAYERLRRSGRVPASVCDRLRARGKDFCMVVPPDGHDAGGVPQFVEVTPVPPVAGSGEVRAMVGPWGSGSVATVWHYLGRQGNLVLDTAGVKAGLLSGQPLGVGVVDGKSIVPISGHRTTLFFPRTQPQQARQIMSAARFSP
jgi:hypothetical protein